MDYLAGQFVDGIATLRSQPVDELLARGQGVEAGDKGVARELDGDRAHVERPEHLLPHVRAAARQPRRAPYRIDGHRRRRLGHPA